MMREEYMNRGKGLVLENPTTADHLMELFKIDSMWTSAELNELVGWQFSQGIYTLRRRGFDVKTLRFGQRQFGYELILNHDH